MKTARLPRRLLLSSAACALALSAGAVWAQPQPAAWPSKPLRLVVGFPPGGGIDAVAPEALGHRRVV